MFSVAVHAIGMELGKPAAMASAVRISLLLCALIYFSIGTNRGTSVWGSIEADYFIIFDQATGSQDWLILLFPNKSLLAKDTKRFLALTLILLGVAYLIAIAIPNIWYFFQFMGSTAAVCIAFIFPGALVLRDVHCIATKKDKIIAATMIILAVVTSTIAISSNLYSLRS
ncbi:amino acid transporter AVT6C-like protein [Tanacetum coccineum]